jgi:tRNA threonylcarbamoyl adenosine modification protein YeaZ
MATNTAAANFALGIYTTGPDLGLSLTNFIVPGRFAGWNLGRELSLYLHQHLRDFMPPQTWSDLQFIAVARGPGSFTSTRLGMVTARTLAQQLEIPLFAVSTLAAAAWAIATRCSQPHPETAIAAEIPAQQGQVYGSLYQFKPDPASITQGYLENLLPDQLVSLEQWQQTLEQQQGTYQRVGNAEGFPSAPEMSAAILDLAYLEWQRGDRPDWSAALPFYG